MRHSLTSVIIFVNVLVFLAWVIWGANPHMPMQLNFLVSWDSIVGYRPWTLITSVFSHQSVWHLVLNMMVLKSFGGLMEQVLGPRAFVGFYLIAGIVSSISHALVSAVLMGAPELPALGASGAIAGLVLLFSLLFPKEKILLFGIIPVPALFGALAFVALDLWGLFEQTQGGGLPIGHGAHLGGALAGWLYFLILRRRSRTLLKPF